MVSEEELTSVHWETFTGVLGPEVNGIWGKYTDTNDVNAADANFEGEVLVTGDDFGMVKLYKFPSLKKGEQKTCWHVRLITYIHQSSLLIIYSAF